MDNQSNLTNHFLIAMPTLADPNFFHSVTYICDHSDNGAMGIIINHPIDFSLLQLFDHMDIQHSSGKKHSQAIYNGGPVENERGFVLHQFDKSWDSTLKITEQLAITTSRDIIEAIADDRGPKKSLVALGYAGWEKGQLEQEIADNAWLCGPADASILFDLPVAKRWEAAAKTIGVDLNLLSTTSGHA
jgi:putative transcriptional regulator